MATTIERPSRPRTWRTGLMFSPGRLVSRVVIYIVVVLFLLFMVLPFLWMLSTSLKQGIDVFSVPPQWIPSNPTLNSFQQLLSLVPFGNFYVNSVKVTASITVGQLIFCSSAAYAFARLRFPGRNLLFGAYLSSLLVPGQVTIIPLYIIIKDLGLLDNHASLILPSLTSAFGTFLLRQFFLNIPFELEEAARVDGAGPFRILSTIYVPLSGAALATLGIFTFNFFWNEFFRPLIFLNTLGNMTIPVALAFINGQYGQNQAMVMAGVVLAVGPVLVLYLFTQRYMVQGITLTGLKG
ncbi:MAG TPA: carbohydrate ABC transporter permease [Chloroflexota bacterium]|nr:carbohydrate ABC transporter permease [Chloroflexota bacterium]